MVKSFLHTIRKQRMKILIAIIIAFFLLFILGYAINPDKTWGPGIHEPQTTSR